MRLAHRIFFPASFLLLAILPTAFLDRLPTLCMYRRFFGFRCLGCGMTHAFSSVLHGKWAAALAYNPLVVIAFPLLAVVATGDAMDLLRQLYRRFHHPPGTGRQAAVWKYRAPHRPRLRAPIGRKFMENAALNSIAPRREGL